MLSISSINFTSELVIRLLPACHLRLSPPASTRSPACAFTLRNTLYLALSHARTSQCMPNYCSIRLAQYRDLPRSASRAGRSQDAGVPAMPQPSLMRPAIGRTRQGSWNVGEATSFSRRVQVGRESVRKISDCVFV